MKPGTTYKQARIFDTGNPGVSSTDRDPDLGSPNEACPGGGPGVGNPGGPNQPGENCDFLGNALIIQESNKEATDDAQYGGKFIFTFAEPVDLGYIGFLGMRSGTHMYAYAENGTAHSLWPTVLGGNAAQNITIPYSRITKLVVDLKKVGAITYLKYSRPGCVAEERRLNQKISPQGQTRNNLRQRFPGVTSSTKKGEETNEEPSAPLDFIAERELQMSGYTFKYGGIQQWICRFCISSVDSRRRLASGFLISALETVLSFGLTADITWSYKNFLEQQNQTIGCLGGGNALQVVFELTV